MHCTGTFSNGVLKLNMYFSYLSEIVNDNIGIIKYT